MTDKLNFWQSTLQAIISGTCLDCGSEDAQPYLNERIPYCEDCKAKHAQQRQKQGEKSE